MKMKRILSLVLVFVMVMAMGIAFCGCGGSGENNENEGGMPNPMVEYDSLEEINAQMHCQLVRPAVMGVTDEAYFIIDGGDYDIAQYNFSVNGYAYTFRYADTTDDISGVYVGDGTAFANTEEMNVATDTYKLARWYSMDGQYCLCVEDNGEIDPATFDGIVEELADMTRTIDWSETYAMLAGDYQDRTSQRATMTVTSNGTDVSIEIDWSSSAQEYTCWTMTAVAYEDGSLNYSDCKKDVVTTKDDGTEETVTEYTDGSGYFIYNAEEEALYWSGAEDAECVDCIFDKI